MKSRCLVLLAALCYCTCAPAQPPAVEAFAGGELDARAVTWANNDTLILRRDGRSAAMTLWERSMGVEDPRSAREKLIAASPARHVERVQAAVLLVHARDDAVVPFGQSRSMQRALLDAGKTVQLVELAGEDHWLSDASTRLEAMRALDAFLAQQLGTSR